MTPTKKLGLPLMIFIGGTAVLAAVWWMNGAERDELWLYIFSVWLVLYAAYEVFVGRK